MEALPGAAERIRLAGKAIWQRELSEEEISLLASYLEVRSSHPQAGLRQMVWAMLSSAEFRFNH
jgi:hypothetical protein